MTDDPLKQTPTCELDRDNAHLASEKEDDFTHYFNACCRLTKENSALKAKIERLQADKDVQRSQDRNTAYEADIKQLRAALQLARSMFLDLERGIAPARADFNKIVAALKDPTP